MHKKKKDTTGPAPEVKTFMVFEDIPEMNVWSSKISNGTTSTSTSLVTPLSIPKP